ncbi:MAG TPA: DUF1559 domain-containing protein [Thermoguttaceae bacterium]|nr:DUF1559 domain-containing protein [Thermoguttaceae bacterium]
MLSGMPPIPRPNNGIDSLNQEGGSDAVSQVPLLWQSRRATKILALVASVFACVFVIVLAFGRRQEQQIVGKWERIDVNNTGERAEFLKDGSAIFYKSNMSMSGRWRFLDDGRFETRATILGVDRAQLHTVKFEFGGDIITLTSEDGTVERHMRVAAFSHDQVKMRLEKEDIRVAGKKVQSLRSINSMKLIGMALLSYRDARGFFPPAYTTDRNGKPLLSWRVLILPQLDQIALYQQFHLNEPWDSEHNMRLIARMPDEYKPQRNESLTGEGKCAYLTVRGEWTIFPGKKSIALNEITDGTSNTIMVVEVPDDRAVIWTRPDDFEYNEQDPLAGLIGPQEDGFLAIIGNGSVCSFPWSIKETTLKALFTRNRGETIDWNTIKR